VNTRCEVDRLLAEQISYYRARAPEYDVTAVDALERLGGEALHRALEAFRPSGHVLELACGTGMWTERLLRDAESVTAVDASPEMIELASARVGGDARVRFVHADLFSWPPERRYDVVFFGFWLSHVPPERFDSFWELVRESLAPDGRVLFVDDAYRSADELIEGKDSATIERKLEDGAAFRIVKVPHTPAGLEHRLAELGWNIEVHATSGPFFWGFGGRLN
jgi:demethylmenaquinone methyltransferase/2-methoxy-6-polyprenyl-1,4-benzoquinol methylase